MAETQNELDRTLNKNFKKSLSYCLEEFCSGTTAHGYKNIGSTLFQTKLQFKCFSNWYFIDIVRTDKILISLVWIMLVTIG